MEIITRSPRGPWSKEVTCTARGNGGEGCQSVLRVEWDDLRWFEGVPGDSWGSRDPEVMFKCPVCDECTDLERQDWPRHHSDLPVWTKAWMDSRPAYEAIKAARAAKLTQLNQQGDTTDGK